MDYGVVLFFVLLIGSGLVTRTIVVNRIRKNENIEIPFSYTKGLVKQMEEHSLEPEAIKKYRLMHIGIFIAIFAVVALIVVVIESLTI
jgi:hypothetical protein